MAFILVIGGFWKTKAVDNQVPSINKSIYKEKLIEYKFLSESEISDRHLAKFNMAQCYFALDSFQQASAIYMAIIHKVDSKLQSICYNHLGLIELKMKNKRLALDYLKSGILADPSNETVKFNYELLKKRLNKLPPEPPPSSIPPPPPTSGGGKPIPTEHLGKHWKFEPLTGTQAMLLLEQQRLKEEQYLQQLRKSHVHDKKYSSDPQW